MKGNKFTLAKKVKLKLIKNLKKNYNFDFFNKITRIKPIKLVLFLLYVTFVTNYYNFSILHYFLIL